MEDTRVQQKITQRKVEGSEDIFDQVNGRKVEFMCLPRPCGGEGDGESVFD